MNKILQFNKIERFSFIPQTVHKLNINLNDNYFNTGD